MVLKITADPKSSAEIFLSDLFNEPTAVLSADVINTFFIRLIYIFKFPLQWIFLS